MPLMMPSPNIMPSLQMISSIDFAQHDIDASQDHDHVRHCLAQAHIFEHGEINETGRANAVTVWVGRTVTDQIKAELSLRRFDASVCFAGFWAEAAELCLR